MDFKTELEELLRRYVPMTGNKERDENTIKLLSIKLEDLHEKYKKEIKDA